MRHFIVTLFHTAENEFRQKYYTSESYPKLSHFSDDAFLKANGLINNFAERTDFVSIVEVTKQDIFDSGL